MANPYFTASGVPTQRSNGVSSVVRQEIANIALAFDKLPAFAGNVGKIVIIGATALTPSAAMTESAGNVTFGGNITAVGITATGNTALGDAQADTLSVSGSLIKGANGNWTLPAAASGDTLNVSALSGAYGVVQSQSMAGGTVKWGLLNTSAAASSAAMFLLSVNGAAAGNPIYQATVSGVTTWTWGIDNADGDSFKIAAAAALGGAGDCLRISSTRNWVFAAPSSGVTVDVNALAANYALRFIAPSATELALTNYQRNGTIDLIIGSVGATDAIVAGAVQGDAVFRTEGRNMLFSVNSGGGAAVKIASTTGNVTIAAPSSGPSLDALGGVRVVGTPATLGATAVGTWVFQTPITRFIFGDGTGYSYAFAKRAASVTTDLVTISDGGSLTINASGTTALIVNATNVAYHIFDANLASGAFGSYRIAGVTKGYIGTDGGGILGGGTGNTFGVRSENDLILMCNAAERIRLSGTAMRLISAGAVLDFTDTSATLQQINSYSSAGLEIVTRTAGAGVSIYYGAAADIGLGIKSDGRVFGRKLHNNAGAVTGTTDQYIASAGVAIWNPTPTNGVNFSTLSSSRPSYKRVGNRVEASIHVTATKTAGAAATLFIPLPIATSSTTNQAMVGMAVAVPGAAVPYICRVGWGMSTTDCELIDDSANTGTATYLVKFSYVVV